MTQPQTRGLPSREEQARAEIGHTAISRPLAVTLTWFFLALIAAVPAAQFGKGWLERRAARPGGAPAALLETPSLSFLAEWRGLRAAAARAARAAPTRWGRIAAANAEVLRRINAFGTRLDDDSVLSRALRTPVQQVLVRLGVGNEKVAVGRDGWLFYEPDVAYAVGPAFLDTRQMARRRLQGGETREAPEPDPVPAIVHFRDQLRERGCALVVMPTPVKPSIHGHALARGRLQPGVVQNRSFGELVRRLRSEGVEVFDCAPLLARRRTWGEPYLRGDTHWRPEAMQAVAADLAEAIRRRRWLAERPPAGYTRVARDVTATGDTALMLKLPAARSPFPPERVTLAEVLERDGSPWRADPAADVLVLGDSFSNIYSLQDMNWGSGAGFAEQLAAELQRPVDRIVRNDAGSYATREMLARELARGQDRLAGKKVVVWQFAAREFAQGDWKRVVLPEPRAAGVAPPATPPDGGDRVRGRVLAVSSRPQKNAVYQDFVMKLHVGELTDARGNTVGNGEGVVHVMAMKAREILAVAAAQPGDRVRLRLRPWDQVSARYGALRAGDLENPALEIEKTLYWGDEIAVGGE